MRERHGSAIREACLLLDAGPIGGLSDGQLLERFASRRGRGGEAAFAALVERHGPMVRGVCRRILGDPDRADDAFQATFLVLARRAPALWVRDSIGPWLHGVARRVALRARADDALRRRHERLAGSSTTPAVAPTPTIDDLGPVLHEELGRLPERYRAPLVLCYLEGLTHEQAANRLDWPVGTVRSRMARGRDRLRDRLERRGAAPAAGALAAGLDLRGPAVSRALALATARDATRFASGSIDPAVAALARGILRALLFRRATRRAAMLLATLVAAAGGAALGTARPVRPASVAVAARRPSPAPDRPRTEAERIADRLLRRGAELFDARQPSALAATYLDGAEVHLVDQQGGRYRDDVRRGRAAIEQLYREALRAPGPIDSENLLDSAQLVAPGLLMIHGRFRPHLGRDPLPFVQARIKRGDDWQVQSMWLFFPPTPGAPPGSDDPVSSTPAED